MYLIYTYNACKRLHKKIFINISTHIISSQGLHKYGNIILKWYDMLSYNKLQWGGGGGGGEREGGYDMYNICYWVEIFYLL